MSESVPKFESAHEDSLEKKKQEGYQHAESIIDNLEGFKEMDYREQFAALTEIETQLEDTDIYAAEYIGAYKASIKYRETRDSAAESIEEAEEALKEIEEYYNIAA